MPGTATASALPAAESEAWDTRQASRPLANTLPQADGNPQPEAPAQRRVLLPVVHTNKIHIIQKNSRTIDTLFYSKCKTFVSRSHAVIFVTRLLGQRLPLRSRTAGGVRGQPGTVTAVRDRCSTLTGPAAPAPRAAAAQLRGRPGGK